MKILDLSRKIHAGMPVYPGDPAVSAYLRCTHEKDGFQLTEIRMGSHTGTHLDAPRHFLPDKETITEVPLDSVVGEAVCVRAKLYYAGGEEHPVIRLVNEDLAVIRPGDRVIISTGWEEKSEKDSFFRGYPIFARDLLASLADLHLRMIGVDLPTVEGDKTGAAETHRMFLSHGTILVEGLVNLSELVGRRFFFSAAPLLFVNGDGAPVRAYAMLEE